MRGFGGEGFGGRVFAGNQDRGGGGRGGGCLRGIWEGRGRGPFTVEKKPLFDADALDHIWMHLTIGVKHRH